MEKPSMEVVVKNVSKGPIMLSAQGYAKVFIDTGKSHTFADAKLFNFYKVAAQGLKNLGIIEISMGGKVDKQIPTPQIFEQEKKMEEAAKASKTEVPVAPAPVEAKNFEEVVGEKEEKKEDKKAGNKNKGK